MSCQFLVFSESFNIYMNHITPLKNTRTQIRLFTRVQFKIALYIYMMCASVYAVHNTQKHRMVSSSDPPNASVRMHIVETSVWQ